MELAKIRCHCIRNWFSIDLSILIADILLEFAFADSLGDVKAAKFLRLIRLLRIIRLGKLTHVSIALRDRLKSRVACIQLNLGLVMLCIILLEHVVACCWFGIGSLVTEGSWLDVHDFRSKPVSLQYATALRWSLSQLGIGGTEIEAVSYAEAVYTVVVAFVSLMSFSTVISSMTSLITSLNKAKVEETDQFLGPGALVFPLSLAVYLFFSAVCVSTQRSEASRKNEMYPDRALFLGFGYCGSICESKASEGALPSASQASCSTPTTPMRFSAQSTRRSCNYSRSPCRAS